jgi:hypothetical protein
MTHTYVTVPVSPATMAQIAAILENDVAGWADAVERDSGNNITLIDMHGLALTPLVNMHHDFSIRNNTKSSIRSFEMEITPYTPRAFEWLAMKYPPGCSVYCGASLMIMAYGKGLLWAIDQIQKAGMTIDFTQT